MEQLNSIYTQERECQDCHKCIRECPVKAIRVQDGYARVVPELCIMCGNCVLTCPNNAKRVRDDLPHAKALLASGRKVIVSLAPSFASQFSGINPAQVIHALKKLGFHAVSETARRAAGFRQRKPTDAWRYKADLGLYRVPGCGGLHR
jgi:Fe-S-cluster-containing hydrogenase component 2